MKKVCAYLSIWMVFSLYGYNPVYIVVHGTWPADADWYLPGGDFFDELVRNTIKQKAYVVPYNWSGKLSHASRVQAAKGLAHVIQSYPVDTPIYVVGHSHGGNVALLASQILGKDRHNEHIIQALYTLGTPISEEQYFPDMNVIMYVYNFYSRSDMVQSVFGTFGREFADHRRIANLRITIEGKEPGHSDLHHPVVARWIPCIPDYLAQKNVNSFQFFSFINPGVIHFNFQSEPRYEIDLREVASKKLVRMYLLKRHPQIA
jgi:pimeloyl-ACP methyl ester carboxylesterase